MPKKSQLKLPALRQLAKTFAPGPWEIYKPKNSYEGVCAFINDNDVPCGNDCPCQEHPEVEAKPEAPKKKFNAAEAMAALRKPKAKEAAQVAQTIQPAQVAQAVVTAKKPQYRKAPVEIYNPAPVGLLPRYIETQPSQVIFYAPKAVELIANIDRLNSNPIPYAHLIIGDTPGLAALEATSALMAHGVPLVQIRRDGNDYVMFWKDSQEHIIARATEVSKKRWDFEILPNAKAGYGVLLLSTQWPLAKSPTGSDSSKNADLLKAFSLKVMNDKSNKDGKWIRYIALDTEYKEGTDVFNVKYIHLFSPMANAADRVQSIGRGVRRCGQRYLEFVPGQGWTVEVFVYATDLKVVDGQPDDVVAEIALAPPEDERTKIARNITDLLYENAVSQVLWSCEQVKLDLVPSQHKGLEYLNNLTDWLNAQSDRGISQSEFDSIIEDLNRIYNDIEAARTDVEFSYYRLAEPLVMNALQERRALWDSNEANALFNLNDMIAELQTATEERRREIYAYVKEIWSRVPVADQHLWYSALSQVIPLEEQAEIPQPELLVAPAQKLPSLPVPTLENLSSIVETLSEDNLLLAQLRSTYQPGYQFGEWILLTQEKQGLAELWLLDPADKKLAGEHSYKRVPSVDDEGIHYNQDAFEQIFPWSLNEVQSTVPPLYAVYTLARVAQQQSCERALPSYLQKRVHILHVFAIDFASLPSVKELIKMVATDKKVDHIYLPAIGVEDWQEAWFEQARELAQAGQDALTIYGPISADPANYGLVYDPRNFYDIVAYDIPKRTSLFVNSWNMDTMIGNGNCGQQSLDAQIGRHTDSIALGWWGSNTDIANNVRWYVEETL